jgi:hypothetical protein
MEFEMRSFAGKSLDVPVQGARFNESDGRYLRKIRLSLFFYSNPPTTLVNSHKSAKTFRCRNFHEIMPEIFHFIIFPPQALQIAMSAINFASEMSISDRNPAETLISNRQLEQKSVKCRLKKQRILGGL